MSHPDGPALQTSARLVRLLISFASHLDPTTGGRARVMRCVGQEVESVVENAAGSLPSAVRQLLQPVIDTLSAATASLPYIAALPLLTSLTRAAELAASSPPSPSPFSLLPNELNARVVQFCQDDDFRLRQNTNLALASTSRAFNLAVQPILEAEAHLFTLGQLIRLADKVDAIDKPGKTIRCLTTSLDVEEIKWKGDGAAWTGRRLPPLLERFLEPGLDTLRITFTGEHDRFEGDYRLGGVLGMECSELEDLFGAFNPTHLELPTIDYEHTDQGLSTGLLDIHRERRSFWFGKDALPLAFDHSHHHLVLTTVRTVLSKKALPPVDYSALGTFAAPFTVWYPSDFLSVLRPLPDANALPSLRHLELTFFIRNAGEDSTALRSIFALLNTSLLHLCLRVVGPGADHRTISAALVEGIHSCTALRHLSLGGRLPGYAFPPPSTTSALETLVLLPNNYDQFNPVSFFRAWKNPPPRFRSLVRYVEPGDGSAEDSAPTYARFVAEWEKVGATFKELDRPREFAWLSRFSEE